MPNVFGWDEESQDYVDHEPMGGEVGYTAPDPTQRRRFYRPEEAFQAILRHAQMQMENPYSIMPSISMRPEGSRSAY